MAAGDRERRGGGMTLTRLAAGLVVVAVLGLAGWIALAGRLDGGEPVVVAAIPEEPASTVAPGELAMRATVPPEQPMPGAEPEPDTATVRIIMPGGGDDGASGPASLARAPAAGLVESSEFGLLPRIAEDGRRSAQIYSRPAPPPQTGTGAPVRIAMVVTGLGISASGTSDAIERLPAEMTLAFAPYGSDLQTWVDRARSNGHEILLQVPMEPFDYPDNDPGPHTLLTTLDSGENIDRLRWLLGRFVGYAGVTNYMGARFTSDEAALGPIIEEIAGRGLAYLDDGTSARTRAPQMAHAAGTGSVRADVSIAAGETREGVKELLGELETVAKERGQALGVAAALPITIDTLILWARDLASRGIVLVPATAVVDSGTS